MTWAMRPAPMTPTLSRVAAAPPLAVDVWRTSVISGLQDTRTRNHLDPVLGRGSIALQRSNRVPLEVDVTARGNDDP